MTPEVREVYRVTLPDVTLFVGLDLGSGGDQRGP